MSKCVKTTDWLIDEEFDGQLDMYDNLKNVCRIELSAYVTEEIVLIRNKGPVNPSAADTSLVSLDNPSSSTAAKSSKLPRSFCFARNGKFTPWQVQRRSTFSPCKY